MKKIIFIFLISTQIAYAQIGNVLVLDGCTNYFEIADNNLLDFNQELSIECWIKPNCEDGNNILLSKQWCNGEFGYYLSVNNGKLQWSYSISGFCSAPNVRRSANIEISTDQFTHVAVVHTQTEIIFFINGLEVESVQNQGVFGEIVNSSEPLRIGAYKNVAGNKTNHYSGLMDEVRIWNIALNGTLIQQRKDSPLQGNESGLILYLNMEQNGQGSSLILENQSSYGSIFNATSFGSSSIAPGIIFSEEYEENIINLGNDISTCDLPISLSIPVSDYKSILWSDGSINNEISVLNYGEYSVIVETELCKFYYDTIFIEQSNFSTLTNNYFLCENDTIIIDNIAYFEEGTYFDTISSSVGGCDTIFVNAISITPSSTNYVQIETCPNSTVFYEGEELEPESITSFTFTNDNGCDSIVTVEITPNLVLTEEVNFIACAGTQIDYNGSLLSPNSSTDFFYSSVEGCDSIVTVNVDLSPVNDSFLGYDTTICSSQYLLNSPNENTLWNDEIVSSSLDVNSSGVYYAVFVDSLECINSDTIQIELIERNIYIPNVFSPNNDGYNDCFKPFLSNDFKFENYKLSIYSRWGGKVFETTDIDECWDGFFNGKPLNSGVFVWVIEAIDNLCNNSEQLRGDITLLK